MNENFPEMWGQIETLASWNKLIVLEVTQSVEESLDHPKILVRECQSKVP